ncbi:fungal specific transcription factor domain-containing protein [Verticillium alfalfae VaMs.102]|uniref:Fungal specific transcription factor domain-containing protein n=1 Tax=Verticillium alfalfae (strain VaMs.102 / ATCC MYA-4576 / FGSC 10136) TaxID=526221 RepID=C9SWT0_VERA1|nr:fungal specific transcription factor domain-containing protein [Verticillium alfalfae VaMs.102]EEY23471.1 fungal specific transcription factor domain-containing protein [Verticillium alfalfae VaMs.102]
MSKTVAFLGASSGVGLATLRATLAAGHRAIALCRTPANLTAHLPLDAHPNLRIVAGNAHDAAAVAQVLQKDATHLVDTVIFTIGARMKGLSFEDPHVCENGIKALLGALTRLRADGLGGRPRLVVCSTTGISRHARDVPLLMVPLYRLALAVPHVDKRAMEVLLEGGGEDFTVVRCSLFVGAASDATIRVGVEDPVAGTESTAIGPFRSPLFGSQMSTTTPGGAAVPAQVSASPSEDSTKSSAPASKLRSCVVCRSRKVRCDKLSPCSNCRRAGIPCTVASSDRPPRWARRLDKLAARPSAPQESEPAAGAVMDRLRTLEKMVKDLGAELEQANAAKSGDRHAPSPDGDGLGSQRHGLSAAPAAGVQPGMGRMLDALKADTQGLAGGDSDVSEDDTDSPGQTASTRESERGASERNGLLFGHNLGPSAPDLGQFRPLPSQIPFLVDVFSENVNFCIQIVHMPALRDMIRDMRGRSAGSIPPANEALAFAVYYAAVTSMSEEDVASSFGAAKAELNYKFRLGLEHALARADFIRLPTVSLVQAFIIFLGLARRHDSPRYVWMMTGLAARMAVAVGLHRDGTHFAHLSPYEVEMRRRVWWCLCLLDIRAAEDQGTEFSIADGAFDTRMPINIMTARTADGGPDVAAQHRLLDAFRTDFATWGFSHHVKDLATLAYWVGSTSTRLVIAKLALFIQPGDAADGRRHPVCRPAYAGTCARGRHRGRRVQPRPQRRPGEPAVRWIRRDVQALARHCLSPHRGPRAAPWSAVVERAWVALHSRWLIPAQPKGDKSARVWIPLRRLMRRARRHRDAEIWRLRADPAAVEALQRQDEDVPVPVSPGPFKGGDSLALFARHWRDVVSGPRQSGHGDPARSIDRDHAGAMQFASPSRYDDSGSQYGETQFSQRFPSHEYTQRHEILGVSHDQLDEMGLPVDWSRNGALSLDLTPGSWDMADFEQLGGADMDMNGEESMNWGQWLESATLMEMDNL